MQRPPIHKPYCNNGKERSINKTGNGFETNQQIYPQKEITNA